MSAQSAELMLAREATEALLGEMGLEAFLFEVEPDEPEWKVVLECASNGGWATVRLRVAKGELLATQFNAALRRELAERWRDSVSPCRSTR